MSFVTVCHQPVTDIAFRRATVDLAYSLKQLLIAGCNVECLPLGSARHCMLKHWVFINGLRAEVLRQDVVSKTFSQSLNEQFQCLYVYRAIGAKSNIDEGLPRYCMRYPQAFPVLPGTIS